ncbi:FAD:protein FMN transferase [Janthinobacterium psychrotolerans]|uniref:FAD:protein FMN transferase n=1 Tax=Janthinobacterium psychrotolerans TaxID=1747903 RepID=A0A1A7CA37_9BURK|nr:FAD:protein FMN transferase [Janthinobacterium psychrotolerans]OBV41630.1 thiamine biosynthesis lipoprotein [Janthinobacterium psychrotolerans]
MKRRSFLTASLGAIAAGSCAWPRHAPVHTGVALAFGTTIQIALVHADEQVARTAIADALAAAQRVDHLMSIYRPGSQVYQLNRDGVLHQPDPHLLAVLAQARALSQLTRGAFDITVQPLWRAWNEALARGVLPAPAQRRQARARVDWRQVAFDARRVTLAPGMAITLNGLAQGYAADMALAAVQAHGVRHALLDTGEFVARGRKRAHQPWTLGVRDPRREQALAATLFINGCGVATSGDYASSFTPDHLHHHIFDPAAGDSPQELASVTVMAPTGMLADGLSTAFMVLGREKAALLAASLAGVDLLAIDKQGREWRSAGFAPQAA